MSVQNAMEQLSRQVSIILAPEAWSFETELAEELVQLEVCGVVTEEGDAESVAVAESASWDVVVRPSVLVGAATEHVQLIIICITYKTI